MDRPLETALVWLRRDLRLHDNAALYHALRAARQVWCAFVFDREILDPLPRRDRRVEFIHGSLVELDAAIGALAQRHGVVGAGLIVREGAAPQEIARLAAALGAQAVYASHDDEPAALRRDAATRRLLGDGGIALHTVKDHVVFERDEVMTQAASPYTVFTPYKNAWLKRLEPFHLKAYPVERQAGALATWSAGAGERRELPSLAALGFEATNLSTLQITPGSRGARELLADFGPRMDAYAETRDFPAAKGPSYLSVHLRFGTVSIRELAALAHARAAEPGAAAGAATWLSELIWRDFYHQVLHHHPRVVGASFKPEYDRIGWETGADAQALFAAWCEGRTGYPLVDAAMAQINRTGYMHNRLRMVVASFLCKDLGLDWRWGEGYFALHLNDYDLAANNGGWQWASSSGCDAQPYFRIFNPVTQSRKFDPRGAFVRRYLPQLAALPDALIHEPWRAPPLELQAAGVRIGTDYPAPIVDHDAARQRTLARYAVVKPGPKP